MRVLTSHQALALQQGRDSAGEMSWVGVRCVSFHLAGPEVFDARPLTEESRVACVPKRVGVVSKGSVWPTPRSGVLTSVKVEMR